MTPPNRRPRTVPNPSGLLLQPLASRARSLAVRNPRRRLSLPGLSCEQRKSHLGPHRTPNLRPPPRLKIGEAHRVTTTSRKLDSEFRGRCQIFRSVKMMLCGKPGAGWGYARTTVRIFPRARCLGGFAVPFLDDPRNFLGFHLRHLTKRKF